MFRGKIMINTCGTFKVQVHDTMGLDHLLLPTELALLCPPGVKLPDIAQQNVTG